MSLRPWDLTDADREGGAKECAICDRVAWQGDTCSAECEEELAKYRRERENQAANSQES